MNVARIAAAIRSALSDLSAPALVFSYAHGDNAAIEALRVTHEMQIGGQVWRRTLDYNARNQIVAISQWTIA